MRYSERKKEEGDLSESQNIKWKLEPGGDGLWSRFPFSAAYQVPNSPVGSASTPKTTQETTQETTLKTISKTILK